MNKAIVALTSLGLVSLGVASLQEDSAPVHLYSANGVHVEALGACDISSLEAHCWNMDGAPDSDLTTRIKNALSSNNQEISCRFGQKNVFLVVDSMVNQPSLMRRPQGYINTVYLNQNGNLRLQLARIDPDEEKGPVTLYATIGGLPGPTSVDLNAAPDSTATVGKTTYTTGTYRVKNNPPVPNRGSYEPYVNSPYGLRASKEWVVAIGTSDSSNSEGYPTFAALDKDKKPITYVDRSGAPVTSLKFIESENVNPTRPGYLPNGNIDPKAKILPAYVSPTQTSVPGAFTLATDIDPKSIAYYRITVTATAKFNLGPFPVQPK